MFAIQKKQTNKSGLISLKKIIQYNQEGRLRALALVMMVKFSYRNSVVYDYSHKKLANKLGLSYYVVKKYVEILKKKGDCHMVGRHLVFDCLKHKYCNGNIRFHRDLDKRYNKRKLSLHDIESLILRDVLCRKGDQQMYIVDKGIMILKEDTHPKVRKRWENFFLDKRYDEMRMLDKNTWSIRTICKIFGVSITKLYDIFKRWQKYKMVKITKRFDYMQKVNCKQAFWGLQARFPDKTLVMTKTGCVYMVQSNLYAFRKVV